MQMTLQSTSTVPKLRRSAGKSLCDFLFALVQQFDFSRSQIAWLRVISTIFAVTALMA